MLKTYSIVILTLVFLSDLLCDPLCLIIFLPQRYTKGYTKEHKELILYF